MNGEYLFDSSIIIDVFRGNAKVIKRIQTIKNIHVPVIVIGELYFGANKSKNTSKRISEIRQMERVVNILNINKSTAMIYGKIKHQLSQRGTPIPENDIWIAALTEEY